MTEKFDIHYIDRGRPPKEPPNPDYPNGIDLDVSKGFLHKCYVKLPYPNPFTHIGLWVIKCNECGYSAACTTAARVDDPRSITIPCQKD